MNEKGVRLGVVLDHFSVMVAFLILSCDSKSSLQQLRIASILLPNQLIAQ